MDALTAMITIAHAQMRLDHIKRHPEILMALSPTLQGIGSKLAMLKHDAERQAASLSADIDSAATETADTFIGAKSALDAHRKDLEDVKAFVAEVNQATNGPPPATPPPPAIAPAADQQASVSVGPYPSYP